MEQLTYQRHRPRRRSPDLAEDAWLLNYIQFLDGCKRWRHPGFEMTGPMTGPPTVSAPDSAGSFEKYGEQSLIRRR